MRRIIRGADVPRNLNTLLSLINFGKDDEPTLAVDKVRYKGEPIVAVVADSQREAFEALGKIRVDYEPLPAVFDVEEALKPGAPVVNETYPTNNFIYHDIYDHQKLRFGDVERGFAEADHVLEQRYQMSPIEHAPTETNGSIAAPETNGRYIVYTSTQALFFSLDTCAKILDVPSNKLHFIGGTVGGGFGGKVDTVTEPLAILGAMLTGRPVRYVFGREEEMQYLLAARRRAHLHQGRRDARRADHRAQGPRAISTAAPIPGCRATPSSNARRTCPGRTPSPTSTPTSTASSPTASPATAMRGFGVTAVDFAIECQMDKLAHLVGMDPMEFRILNAYRDGDMKAHRREAQEHRADRMRPGRGGEGQVADPRRIQAHVLAQGRRRRARRHSADARAIPACSTPGGAQQRTSYDRAGRRRRRRARPAPAAAARPGCGGIDARGDAVFLGLRQEAVTWRSFAAAAWPRSTIPSA